MHVIYKPERPEDGDRQEWDFRPGRVRASEAERLQHAYGGTWDQFQAGVQRGDIKARRIMLWYLLTRQHSSLQLKDVPDFYSDELEVHYSVQELVRLREAMAQSTMDTEQRDLILTALDKEMTEAMEREGLTEAPETVPEPEVGKAPSPTSSTDGGSVSPS